MLHLVITLTPNEDIAHAAYATWAAQQLIWSSFLVPLATASAQQPPCVCTPAATCTAGDPPPHTHTHTPPTHPVCLTG
jgi:hypothetical protein